jgi:hypothetical protein
LKAVAGYRLIGKRRNEDVRKKLHETCVTTSTKDYQTKWLEHTERKEDQRNPVPFTCIPASKITYFTKMMIKIVVIVSRFTD